jgi:putative SOS response-associated peptidase YedK
MCGRYLTPGEADIEREFHVLGSNLPSPFRERHNVAPTQQVAVIRSTGGRRELARMRWGLIPFFAHGEAGRYATFNARVETVRTSPAYRGPWRRGQRCLVPAEGFYEWQVVPGGKQPWYIGCADQTLCAFAGLWDSSTPPGGEPILSVTVITLPASPMMAEIHNTKQREPAILRREDHETWLSGTPEEAFACLQPYADALRSAWPVERDVPRAAHA